MLGTVFQSLKEYSPITMEALKAAKYSTQYIGVQMKDSQIVQYVYNTFSHLQIESIKHQNTQALVVIIDILEDLQRGYFQNFQNYNSQFYSLVASCLEVGWGD